MVRTSLPVEPTRYVAAWALWAWEMMILFTANKRASARASRFFFAMGPPPSNTVLVYGKFPSLMSGNPFHARNSGGKKGRYWKVSGKDVAAVVKGVSRQVIVVKSPDPRLFEQAIFIVKEDAFGQGVSAEQVLQEARRVADGYLRRNVRLGRPRPRVPAPAWVAAGALLATIGWSVGLLL